MAGFITDAQLKSAVANVLQMDVAALPAFWDDLITKANQAAYQDIYTALIKRGFSVAVCNAWDRGAELQADIGLYWALLRGGALGQYSDGFKGLDRRRELASIEVTVSGIWQQPGQPIQPQEQNFAEVNSGTFDTSTDMVVVDTGDPRRGQITRW